MAVLVGVELTGLWSCSSGGSISSPMPAYPCGTYLMPSPDMVFLSLGSNARHLEDLASGASGLPRQQVPVPSQASLPPRSTHDRLLEGSTGRGWGPRWVCVCMVTGCAWVQARKLFFLSSLFLSRQALTVSVSSYVPWGTVARCCPQHVPGSWGWPVLDNPTL